MSYICMVVDGAYPNDIRVRKEAEALVKNGKKVLVVCPRKRNDAQKETVNGVQIFRIGKNYTFFKKGVYDVIESVFNFHPFFYFGLKKVFKKYKIDFLQVHDLPLAGTCYLFKSKVDKKLLLDLHENFPEALKTWFLWKKSSFLKLKNQIFMNPKHWSKKEEKYCKKYDVVICVVEEMKTKLISKFAIDEKKLVVVSNHEEKAFVSNFENNTNQNCIDANKFSITYVGGFGPHRGLDTAIEGMPEILKTCTNAKLYLVGKGSTDVQEKLESLIIENNLQQAVEIVGYRPFKEVAAIMQVSKINIIPHKSDEHTNNTIPHKLFQIMLSKSLLLVSSCAPLKRIVEKYDAGLVFEANNAADFSAKVLEAYQNYEAMKPKMDKAYDAVVNKGENWESESMKLVELYNSLSV
ncbi:glycosyltransferase [Flavicella sediminum]|uniref:glycosyltransferase n=1 Tax=Flavicella sediminum TaxID=2585141 RepID=UPI0011216529|nr:glycosyltransferase [Flavicella sediminum]